MKYQLEYVIWEDVLSNDRWMHVSDIPGWVEQRWTAHHVGFVIFETKDILVLSSVMTNDPGDETFGAKYKIPKKYIIKRVKIKIPKIKL